jgi:hypothetical protein
MTISYKETKSGLYILSGYIDEYVHVVKIHYFRNIPYVSNKNDITELLKYADERRAKILPR